MADRHTVLVVDDEHTVRETVAEMLSLMGFDVLQAKSGYEAICVITERNIDLLLTDVVLPGISGFQLARQAKQLNPTMRILYATGYDLEAEGREGTRHGKLLYKPLRFADLAVEVGRALAD